jgi:hypothetical protein
MAQKEANKGMEDMDEAFNAEVSGVTVVLQWCHSGITVLSQWCHSCDGEVNKYLFLVCLGHLVTLLQVYH